MNGNNCNIKISGITINGNNNTITGDNNTISGNNNRVIGNGNNISGDNNKVKGDNNKIDGNNNKCDGIGNTLKGNNNRENGKYINTDDKEFSSDKQGDIYIGDTNKTGYGIFIRRLNMNDVKITEDDNEVRAYTNSPLMVVKNNRDENGNIVERFLMMNYTKCGNIEIWYDMKRNKYISHMKGKKIVVNIVGQQWE